MLSARLGKDCEGAALVEFTIVLLMLLLVIGGIVDFSLAFWQMNMATKAVERGARIAAVSTPVASNYADIDTVAGGTPGDALPADFAFDIKCDGGAGSCSCVSGSCAGVSYDADAMNTIVYGRGNGGACNTAASNVYAIGMCNLLNTITPANVIVEYTAAPGVGFRGRPCGPVSTITVSLQNVMFGWFFLGGLMSFADLRFPSMRTTITSEDLSIASPLDCT
jgi:hypothetical protein